MTDLALFESLLSCNTVSELHTRVGVITKQMGFEHFVYGFQINRPSAEPYQFIISGYPDEWWKHYCDSGYQKIDPVVSHCFQSVVPLLWEDLIALRPDSKKLMNEAKDCGLATGLTVPLRGIKGDFGLLSVAAERNVHTRKDISHSASGVQLLASYMHEAAHRLVLSSELGAECETVSKSISSQLR